ncbi:MAG: ABC transporter permease [Oscillospiraceae bacterium]
MYMSEEISNSRRAWIKKRKLREASIKLCKIGLLFFLIFLWEILARTNIIDPFITSSPTRIIRTIGSLFQSGDLWRHIFITTFEAVSGFVLGTFFGTLIATLLWCSPFLCSVAEPYLVVLNALPKIALGPIFIVWLGSGPRAIIIIALSISLVVSILEVLGGFLTTDKEMIQLVKGFGGTKYQVLTKVVFPANIGTIMGSLKINVGMSWVGVIVGEFLISKAGLGYLIVYGSQVFKLDLVMASVVILAAVATFMYFFIECMDKKMRGSSKHI